MNGFHWKYDNVRASEHFRLNAQHVAFNQPRRQFARQKKTLRAI